MVILFNQYIAILTTNLQIKVQGSKNKCCKNRESELICSYEL